MSSRLDNDERLRWPGIGATEGEWQVYGQVCTRAREEISRAAHDYLRAANDLTKANLRLDRCQERFDLAEAELARSIEAAPADINPPLLLGTATIVDVIPGTRKFRIAGGERCRRPKGKGRPEPESNDA